MKRYINFILSSEEELGPGLKTVSVHLRFWLKADFHTGAWYVLHVSNKIFKCSYRKIYQVKGEEEIENCQRTLKILARDRRQTLVLLARALSAATCPWQIFRLMQKYAGERNYLFWFIHKYTAVTKHVQGCLEINPCSAIVIKYFFRWQ